MLRLWSCIMRSCYNLPSSAGAWGNTATVAGKHLAPSARSNLQLTPLKAKSGNVAAPELVLCPPKAIYAVASGRSTGLFQHWQAEVQPLVDGYSGARYQRFDDRHAAQQWLEECLSSSSNHSRAGPPMTSASSTRKGSFYAVARGWETGIFTSWFDEAAPAVAGYGRALHRKFSTRREAEDWLHQQQFEAATCTTSGAQTQSADLSWGGLASAASTPRQGQMAQDGEGAVVASGRQRRSSASASSSGRASQSKASSSSSSSGGNGEDSLHQRLSKGNTSGTARPASSSSSSSSSCLTSRDTSPQGRTSKQQQRTIKGGACPIPASPAPAMLPWAQWAAANVSPPVSGRGKQRSARQPAAGVANYASAAQPAHSNEDDGGGDLLSSPTSIPTSHLLEFDGGSRGNPGIGGFGAMLREGGSGGRPVHVLCGVAAEPITNNQAEYMGLLHGMQAAAKLGSKQLTVQGDSQLVTRQLTGQYKVKSEVLRPLFNKVQHVRLCSFEAVTPTHVLRQHNKVADALGNIAMDAAEVADDVAMVLSNRQLPVERNEEVVQWLGMRLGYARKHAASLPRIVDAALRLRRAELYRSVQLLAAARGTPVRPSPLDLSASVVVNGKLHNVDLVPGCELPDDSGKLAAELSAALFLHLLVRLLRAEVKRMRQ